MDSVSLEDVRLRWAPPGRGGSGPDVQLLDHLVVERGLADNTLKSYRRDLRRYAGWLADRGVESPSRRATRRRRHGRLPDVVERLHALVGQPAGVPAQVAAVGLQGVVGQPALDDEVVEVRPDRAQHLTGGAHLSQDVQRHVSMPCASATGWLVSEPSWVLRPVASARSSRAAPAPAPVRPARRCTAAWRWSARRWRCSAPRPACWRRSRRPSRGP